MCVLIYSPFFSPRQVACYGRHRIVVVLCTVVLLCSWSFMIYSNWKGKKDVIQFPPYGYDECPIGYKLDSNDINKCTAKEQLKHIRKAPELQVAVNPAAREKMTSTNVCNFFKEYKDGNKPFAWDGLPTKYTYKDPEASRVREVLDGCCFSGTNKCSSLDFQARRRRRRFLS